jgi:predicted Fe-Mo cluster-binding NifX family protein
MRTFIVSWLGALLLAASVPALPQQGKSPAIAVAANANTPSASVASQAGRSAFFLFFNKQGTFIEAVRNPYMEAGSAGIPMVDFLAGKGITVLVAEGFGPNIVSVMKDKGIRAVEFKGTAQDAVKKALATK